MYLKDQLPPDADYDGYKQLLKDLSCLLVDCVTFPVAAFDVAMHASYGDGNHHHGTVLMLIRHFCEQMDGAAVLFAEGCAEPSKPLLRSAFEAQLAVMYILEKDCERRGLAYQVAHAHRRIKLYKKLDPADQSGAEFRKRIKDDPIAVNVIGSVPTAELPSHAARFEKMLTQPPYAAIEAEWKRRKEELKGREPSWLSLFGGPRTISGLASHLGKASWYELMYSEWSDVVHAGSSLRHIAKNPTSDGGPVVIRPLRHPEGLQSLLNLAAAICLELTRTVLSKYGDDEQRRKFQDDYVARVQSPLREVRKGDLIDVPWR